MITLLHRLASACETGWVDLLFAKAIRVTVSQFSLRNCTADKRRLHHSHMEPVLGQLEL